MQKLIPAILILALAGGGYAFWRSMNAEPEQAETEIEEPVIEDVEEESVPTVEVKEGDDSLVPSAPESPKGDKAPGVERGPQDRLQGRVLDAVTREPVAGVDIELFKFKFRHTPATKTGRIRIEFDENTVTRVKTGNDGHYQFTE